MSGKTIPSCILCFASLFPCSPQPHATHDRQGASSKRRPRGPWLRRHGNALRAHRRHRYSNRLGDRSRAGPEQGRGNALTVSKSSTAISSSSSVELGTVSTSQSQAPCRPKMSKLELLVGTSPHTTGSCVLYRSVSMMRRCSLCLTPWGSAWYSAC